MRRNSKQRPSPVTLAITTSTPQVTANGPPSAQALVGIPAPSATPIRQASNHGTHPYSNVAVHTGSDYAGRTMTDGSFVNTGANTPTAVYGRQSPMVPGVGVSNVPALAQPGYSPQQQQQGQQPQEKSKGIFGLLVGVGEPSQRDGVLFVLDLSSCSGLGFSISFCRSLVFWICAYDARYDARYDPWRDLVILSHPHMQSLSSLPPLNDIVSFSPSLLLTPYSTSTHLLSSGDVRSRNPKRIFTESVSHTHSRHHISVLQSRIAAAQSHSHVTYCSCAYNTPNNSIVHVLFASLFRRSPCQSLLSTLSFSV